MKSTPTYECFHAGKDTKIACARSGEYGGCEKTVTCFLARSSSTRTERCTGALSYSNSQFYIRQSSGRLRRIESYKRAKDLLVAGFVYSCTFSDDFYVNMPFESKTSSSIALPLDLSCHDFSVLAILAFFRWRMSLQLRIVQ